MTLLHIIAGLADLLSGTTALLTGRHHDQGFEAQHYTQ